MKRKQFEELESKRRKTSKGIHSVISCLINGESIFSAATWGAKLGIDERLDWRTCSHSTHWILEGVDTGRIWAAVFPEKIVKYQQDGQEELLDPNETLKALEIDPGMMLEVFKIVVQNGYLSDDFESIWVFRMCSKYVWEGTMNKDFFLSGLNFNNIYNFLLDLTKGTPRKQENLKQIWEEPWVFYSIAINFQWNLSRFNNSIMSEDATEKKYANIVEILLDIIFAFSLWACRTHTKSCPKISCCHKTFATLLDEHYHHNRAVYNPETRAYIVDKSVSRNKCSFRLEKSGIKIHKPYRCYLVRASGMKDMITLFMNSPFSGNSLTFTETEPKLGVSKTMCVKRQEIMFAEYGSLTVVGS